MGVENQNTSPEKAKSHSTFASIVNMYSGAANEQLYWRIEGAQKALQTMPLQVLKSVENALGMETLVAMSENKAIHINLQASILTSESRVKQIIPNMENIGKSRSTGAWNEEQYRAAA